MPVDTCPLCQLVTDLGAEGEIVALRPGFTLNRFQGESDRPRLVLQPERHVTRFADLTDDEARNLGQSIRDAAAAVEAHPGVARCYIQSFNETPPGHLHVHLVPRFTDDPQPHGPQLSDDNVPDSATQLDLDALTGRPHRSARSFTHSPLTDLLKRVLELWNTRLSLYGPLRAGLTALAPRHRPDIGEAYVLMWLVVLAAAVTTLTVASAPAWLVVSLCVVAGYRWVDLVAYTGRILLTTEPSPLQSVARSLVLFGLNLVELRLIRTTWILADGHDLNAVWLAFVGAADDPHLSPWTATGAAAVTLASAVVLGLAVAMVVGKIGETFTDTSRATSPTS